MYDAVVFALWLMNEVGSSCRRVCARRRRLRPLMLLVVEASLCRGKEHRVFLIVQDGMIYGFNTHPVWLGHILTAESVKVVKRINMNCLVDVLEGHSLGEKSKYLTRAQSCK